MADSSKPQKVPWHKREFSPTTMRVIEDISYGCGRASALAKHKRLELKAKGKHLGFLDSLWLRIKGFEQGLAIKNKERKQKAQAPRSPAAGPGA